MKDFLGYNVFDGSFADCADAMAAEIQSGRKKCQIMACLNPHSYIVAKDDTAFHNALKGVTWLVPDGAGVVIGARILGNPLPGRVTGPDVFEALLERLGPQKRSVFFLGSSASTLAKMSQKMAERFPHVRVAGTYSPPFVEAFTAQENKAIIDAVNAAAPDVLWVGMTAPKQEKWLAEHQMSLQVGVAGAVGAAFDFFAGTVKRPPILFQKLNLEWAYRWLKDPVRLLKRNMSSSPKFLIEIFRVALARK